MLSRQALCAELAEDLAAAERVIFVDATAQGKPGEVQAHQLSPDATAILTMAHSLDLRELLAWCETMHRHAAPPRCTAMGRRRGWQALSDVRSTAPAAGSEAESFSAVTERRVKTPQI